MIGEATHPAVSPFKTPTSRKSRHLATRWAASAADTFFIVRIGFRRAIEDLLDVMRDCDHRQVIGVEANRHVRSGSRHRAARRVPM